MFENIRKIPADPIFNLLGEYLRDSSDKKVNLGIGLYSDREGKSFVFPSIKKAFFDVNTNDFNYQPIGGNRNFLNLAGKLLFGEMYNQNRIAAQAVCGGTQACRMFADLVMKENIIPQIYIGTPTWSNHFALFEGLKIVKFNHLADDGEVCFDEYLRVVREMERGSILLIHGGQTHNPTGKNLSIEQLEQLLPLIKAKGIFLFVDFAYLGFGEGMAEDRRYMEVISRNLSEFGCGLSFSKNASLYEFRVGCLFIQTNNKEAVESNLEQIARSSISMAPGIGQEIMINVFERYMDEWLEELDEVRRDIDDRKYKLINGLPLHYAGLRETKGMFGLLPLDRDQIFRLKEDFSVYLPENGRINFAGLNDMNLEYVIEAISRVS